MKKLIITQARMTSTRLPGKVMKKILDKPLLLYHLERLNRVKQKDEVIVATTNNDTDLPIVDLCKEYSVLYYRGSENDVLSRYYEAAKEFKGDIIVRVTSDCPLIDPEIIDQVIKSYITNYPKYDYVSNTITRTYPRGMDAEVFSFKALERAYEFSKEDPDREHVTRYILRNTNIFNLFSVENNKDSSKYRLTVDTKEDFELIKKILELIYTEKPEYKMKDCLELLNNNPELEKINSHINQKEV